MGSENNDLPGHNEAQVSAKTSGNDNKKEKENKTNPKEENKRKFSMPSSLTIIVIVLFAIIFLTWIASWTGAQYSVDTITLTGSNVNDYFPALVGWPDGLEVDVPISVINDALGTNIVIKNDVEMMGLLSFGQAMSFGFTDAASLIFYLFVLGAIIQIMLVSGSLEAGVSSLVKGFNGKELLLIPIMVLIFSAGGTIFGMQEETIGLFIIIVPTLALAGFDTVTGLLVVLLGTTTGFAASTVNPFSVGAAVDAAGEAIVTIGNGLIFRLVWWIILTGVAASAVTGYAWYVRKNPEKSFNKQMKEESDEWLEGFSSKEEHKSTKKQIAAVSVFMVTFVLMIIMFIPWTDLFDFEYSSIPWLNWLIGGVNGPGLWYFEELSMLFIVAGVIIALILNMGIKETSKAAWTGAKDMLSVGIIIGIARSIPYILETSGTQNWMVQGLSSGLNNMNPIGFIYVMFFIFLILGLLVPSTSGLASLSMGIFMPLAIGVAESNGIDAAGFTAAIMMVFVLATGIVNMFVPTQAVVMASCASAHVSYGDAMKPALTFAGGIILITLVAVIPSTLILF